MQVVTRKEAVAAGLTRYFTGRSCKRKHIVERITSSKACALCSRANRAQWFKSHPEVNRAAARKWAHNNPDKVAKMQARWCRENPEKHNAGNAQFRAQRVAQVCTCCTKKDLLVFYDTRWLGEFEVDHRVPLALGGLHCVRNLQALTPEQHRIKTNLDVRIISQVRSKKLSLEAAVRYLEAR